MNPNEEPRPEPEKSPEAKPKPASKSFSTDPLLASAYVPRPGRKPKSTGMLALAALIVAGGLGAAGVYYKSTLGTVPPGVNVLAPAEQQKILYVSDADINVSATEKERKNPPVALPPGSAPAAAQKNQQAPAPAPAVANAPVQQTENRASSPLPVAPPELVNPPASAPQSALTPQGQNAVRADGYSIFSMQLLDDVAEDGDVVQISVDGVPVSFLSLSHAGAKLEIPLKKGESHQITITAVKDGTGGVTLGMRTSVGDITSRNMAVGESDTWTVGFK